LTLGSEPLKLLERRPTLQSIQEDFLIATPISCKNLTLRYAIFLMLASAPVVAQGGVQLENSETLFAVLTAINNCGYDAGLAASDPVRMATRREFGSKIESSEAAKAASDSLCAFFHDHQQATDARTLSSYISLALYLNPPPALTPKVKEADLPPDAGGVLGMVPLLSKFYAVTGGHEIWQQHTDAYAALNAQYREPLTRMISATEMYLRLPSANYQGRSFTVYVEPMGAPAETNARSYASDYYVVTTPAPGSGVKLDLIRHAFLHFLLDPMVGKFAENLKSLSPLMDSLRLAPMDEGFKEDPSLLVTECLIRAVEARTLAGAKARQSEQDRSLADSEQQGFTLTRYFYQRLLQFEKDSIGLRAALPAMIAGIDVRPEQRRAAQIQFASAAEPELLHLARPKEGKLLATAEQRLSAGDIQTAEKLAKQALAEKSEDPGRALFILAQIALRGGVNDATGYFDQALRATSEPKVVAWSHIYLGRILDLQDDDEDGPKRAAAIEHYKAAVNASGSLPEAKAAAEEGLQKPYAPPNHAQQQQPHPEDEKQ
jgi:hypothetical protein